MAAAAMIRVAILSTFLALIVVSPLDSQEVLFGQNHSTCSALFISGKLSLERIGIPLRDLSLAGGSYGLPKIVASVAGVGTVVARNGDLLLLLLANDLHLAKLPEKLGKLLLLSHCGQGRLRAYSDTFPAEELMLILNLEVLAL